MNKTELCVDLLVCAKTPHISQIITGFHMLSQQNIIKLKYINNNKNTKQLPHNLFIEAIINGHLVGFDVCDGIDSDMDIVKYISYLERSKIEYIFMRSYSAEIVSIFPPKYRDMFFPLGLNYHVTFRGNPIDSPVYVDGLKGKIRKTVSNLGKRVLGVNKSLYVENFSGGGILKKHITRQQFCL